MQNMESTMAMIAAARLNRSNVSVEKPEVTIVAPLDGVVWHEKPRVVSAHNLTHEHRHLVSCCSKTVVKGKGKATEGFLAPNIRQTVWGRHNPNHIKL